METTTTDNWSDANQRYLVAALDVVKRRLESHATAEGRVEARVDGAASEPDLASLAQGMPGPAAIESLTSAFGLSPFERAVVLLCAGMELDSAFPELCARAQGDAQRAYPTFSLAMAALPEPHWSALTPTAPLRFLRLIDVKPGSSLVQSPLRIDERILHFLTGVGHLDENLIGFAEPVAPPGQLVASHARIADAIAATWAGQTERSPLPVVQLCGPDEHQAEAIAAAACAALRISPYRISASVLPTSPVDFETLIRLWQREAILGNHAVLLDCHDIEANNAAREALVTRAMKGLRGPIIVTSRLRRNARGRALLTFDVEKPTADEQRALWVKVLGTAAEHTNGQLDRVLSQFDLSTPAIIAACGQATSGAAEDANDAASGELGSRLWDACRTQARPRLDDLAQRIVSAATWDDLVLPELQRATLGDIARHVRHRATVYEKWGFAAKSRRGLGISALFAGASGTGKTLAAEVLAGELQLDLYRIDLSQVVSKYIGETEKNLRRVFDAAEEGGAVLLFDEADALFGKRSEVKDSHDRYANIEVGYLLQRMEAYRGLAILTTNMKNALDTAFLRRLRFIIQFPFPDAAQRCEIWQRIFPADTPTAELDPAKLAQLNITGGNIRNIALCAAFLAADDGRPVRMEHALRAARGEYTKLDKSLTDVEIKGWM